MPFPRHNNTMEPLRFTRKPKNWLEKLLWNISSFWKVYEMLGGETKEIPFNPYQMSCGQVIIHFQQIKEREAECPFINEDSFILWAAQRPSGFAGILSHVISIEKQQAVQSWLEANCTPLDLADAYLIYRRIILDLGDRMIGLADQFGKPAGHQ